MTNTTYQAGAHPSDRYGHALDRYLAVVCTGEMIEESAALVAARSASGHPMVHPLARLQDLVVADVMVRDVVSVPATAPMKDVVRVLAAAGISAVPVIDDERHVLGIVSEADLLAHVVTGGERRQRVAGLHTSRRQLARRADGETAADMMSAPAITAGQHTSVIEAARQAARARIRRMPVVDNSGRLVGIVARRDLLSLFLRTDAEIADIVRTDVLRERMCLDPQDFEITVDGGVVTLRGQVDRRRVIGAIIAAVGEIAGVVAVHDELTFRVDDTVLPPRTPLR